VLARELVTAGTKAGLRAVALQRTVESGIAVPMYFLVPGRDLPVLATSVSDRPAEACRRWGTAIRDVLAARPERIAFVVSGLLSFNAHAWDLKREVPEAAEFDERALASLKEGRWDGLADGDARTLQRIQPEASLRHLDVLRGFLGADVRGTVLGYEALPGAGQALIEFPVPGGVPAPAGSV
jgi:aromatic ring-opening dioxygenase catalytic subunit (LigB family)